ncbi:flagellar assembly protein FliW [Caminibacter mediatlanticus]|uniref:flagellar assembly protein FliW n=1 Tax=Caminibacter mediatlanticus TaxID=291048 RepID=UPI003BAB3B68
MKDYSFEIPADVKVLLDIKAGDGVYVYALLVKKEPISESIVNLKAPIIINPKNNTLAQLVLDDYGFYKLADFIKE